MVRYNKSERIARALKYENQGMLAMWNEVSGASQYNLIMIRLFV